MNNVRPGATRAARLEAIVARKAAATALTVGEVEAAIRAEIPVGRIGEAGEVGAVVAFLASPYAGYVSGASIPVDGGRMHGV